MPDGQADNTAPESMDELAAFLVDNPLEGDQREEGDGKPADKATADNGDTDEDSKTAPQDEDQDEADDDKADKADDEADDDKADDDETSGKTFKVTVKNDDGEDEDRQVTLGELQKGYMRQADYSRKLAGAENSRKEFAQQGVAIMQQARESHAKQLAENYRFVEQIAGFRNSQEMLQLSISDPAAYAQESARIQLIHGYLAQTRQLIQAEQTESERQREALREQEKAHAWGVLGNKGINSQKLEQIYRGAIKHFGWSEKDFANVTDPRLILMMQAANSYKELQGKAKTASTQVKTAPPLPKQRQNPPRNERVAKQLDGRFKNGRATQNDLAAFILMNKL